MIDAIDTEQETNTEKDIAPAEEIRTMGQALIDIAKALDGLDREAAIRVIRAVAILHKVDLECVGLQEIDLMQIACSPNFALRRKP